jgi:glycosyltransferase involved in cell wall biosynthesis
MLSVIVPAYRSDRYIDQCIDSLKGAEILIGVDACEPTLQKIKDRSDVRIFYFQENVGPYVIKNTLIDEASHNSILFFDSDDVLAEGVLERIEQQLTSLDYLKLNYVNFQVKINKSGQMMSDAVIAIKRDVFNSLNGFYPWKCAADTEFHSRLVHNSLKHKTLDGVAYYRRLHGENLTLRKDLGHGSPIRNSYKSIISKNQASKNWPNPNNKTISEYVTY